MKQIRPITQDEAPEFLTLLCSIFELDVARASTIFYSEPFFDVNRKWATFIDGRIVAILTTTPLEFGDGPAIGIAGVGTDSQHRGSGLAQELLERVWAHAEEIGEARGLLFAHQETLYNRCGFQTLDHVIRGPIDAPCSLPLEDPLAVGEVQDRYHRWASADLRRLKRDERRWRYWNFIYRECYQVPGGYLASEANLCRELICTASPEVWPLLPEGEWYGLRSMTDELGIPLRSTKEELILMGRGFNRIPQMFMSDQF